MTEAPAAELAALVEESTKRTGMVWLDLRDGEPARAAWHVWHEGAAYVVSGGAEQQIPGIESATEVRVTVRAKESGARLVTWVAEAETVRHGTTEWTAAAEALRAVRLNAPEAESLTSLWGADSTITRLRPTGEVPERPGAQPDGSHAAVPVPTDATTRGRAPWTVHRRQRRAPDL